MKSVGETMAIGRTFKESLQKALRGLETGQPGFGSIRAMPIRAPRPSTARRCARSCACPTRALYLRHHAAAYPLGLVDRGDPRGRLRIDPWFLENIRELVEFEQPSSRDACSTRAPAEAKELGYSDRQIALAVGATPDAIEALRRSSTAPAGATSSSTPARPSSRPVTPYYYSTWEERDRGARDGQGQDHDPRRRPEPHRPGHRVRLLLRARRVRRPARSGCEAMMVNSNPETVSTDYDTSDHLFFEPLTHEDVMNIVRDR